MLGKDPTVCDDQSTRTPPSLLEKGTKDTCKAYTAFEDENKRMDFSCKNDTLWSLLSGHVQRVLNTDQTHTPFIISQHVLAYS